MIAVFARDAVDNRAEGRKAYAGSLLREYTRVLVNAAKEQPVLLQILPAVGGVRSPRSYTWL